MIFYIIIYNLILFYSFEFNIKILYFYWRNIFNVSLPYDTDHFPYIQKFKLLYKLNKNNINDKYLINYISKNTKIFPNISNKSILTDQYRYELTSIMNKYNIIRAEILNIWNNHKYLFLPMGENYGNNLFTDNKWRSLYFIKNNIINKELLKLLPFTIKKIYNIPSFYNSAFISVLKPGSIIPLHHGRFNFKSTCHIGIDGLDNCKFIIEDEILKWEIGKYFIFNDYSYHKVIHNGNKIRVVLIFDLLHNELNIEQKRGLKLLF